MNKKYLCKECEKEKVPFKNMYCKYCYVGIVSLEKYQNIKCKTCKDHIDRDYLNLYKNNIYCDYCLTKLLYKKYLQDLKDFYK